MKALENYSTIILGCLIVFVVYKCSGFEKTVIVTLGAILGKLSIILSRQK